MQDKLKLEPIAVFAGRGQLPQILIEECQRIQRRFIVFLLKGEIYEYDYSSLHPYKIAYGEIENFLKIIKDHKIKNLVFIGAVTKPNFSSLKVDKTGALLLAKILANKILGDDAVLRTVIKFLEKQGLKLIPIEQLLDCVISKKSIITKKQPTTQNQADIELGVKAIRYFSKFDVGQSLIVAQRQIIAIEALEGTDAMISRCQSLGAEYTKNAVLIKMKKSHQSGKADLPTIGLTTIKNCAESKICGLAIQANSTLVLDKPAVIKAADELGLFISVF